MGETIVNGIKGALGSVAKWAFLGVVNNSYTICLGISMVGLILYLAGYKKGAKWTSVSLVVYICLQAIGSLL